MMSYSIHKPFTRRSFVAGLATTIALPAYTTKATKQFEQITPIDLGHGLEIRDYRLFPTEDVMRFIVEIHNTTDSAVDTPTVGVVLPHLDDDNFGWATPVSPVLHPHTSECLFGVAPESLAMARDWGSPNWVLCDKVQAEASEALEGLDIEFTFTMEIVDSQHARALYKIYNGGDERIRQIYVQGTIWDQDERVCGLLLPSSLHMLRPHSHLEKLINVHPRANYTSNPFSLIDTVEGTSFTCTLQPAPQSVNQNCTEVMPWSR